MNEHLKRKFVGFRAETMGIQKAFSAMTPIIERTRRLSMNAEITSSRLGEDGRAFAIIAQELVKIIGDLEVMIAELKEMFLGISRDSARWLKAEIMIEKIQSTLEKVHGYAAAGGAPPGAGAAANLPAVEGGVLAAPAAGNGTNGGGPTAQTAEAIANIWLDPLEPGATEYWLTQAAQNAGDAAASRLWGMLVTARGELLVSLVNIVQGIRRLNYYVDRINWIAVRQCHFTAIMARVEAAKMNGNGGEIRGVAMNIQELSVSIQDSERFVRERIDDVRRAGVLVTGPLQGDMRQVQGGANG